MRNRPWPPSIHYYLSTKLYGVTSLKAIFIVSFLQKLFPPVAVFNEMVNCKYSFWESSTYVRIRGLWIAKANNPLGWSLFLTSNKLRPSANRIRTDGRSVDLGIEQPLDLNESALYIKIHWNSHREHRVLPLARPTTCQCYYVGESWPFVRI
jgi:hypothetical protein